MSFFFVSRISKSRFYYTEPKQNNSPELLNLLFKHISHKNDPKKAEHLPIFVPIIFLRFSYAFPMNI